MACNKLSFKHCFKWGISCWQVLQELITKVVPIFGNSFFSLPKCKVVFVRWYLTCKVVPYKKILVENERPYKKPCKVVPYKKII